MRIKPLLTFVSGLGLGSLLTLFFGFYLFSENGKFFYRPLYPLTPNPALQQPSPSKLQLLQVPARNEPTVASNCDGCQLLEKIHKVKVLCWIMTQPHNHESKAFYVNRTWGPRCDKHFFLTSSISSKDSSSNLPFVEIKLQENRNNLWSKTVFAFEYIHDHFLKDYDFFLKADDDSYIVVENLKLLLSNRSSDEPFFAGRHFKPYVKQGYMSGGASYALSREAVKRFVTKGMRAKNPHCPPSSHGGAEDVNMGKCLEAVGVKVLPSIDSKGEERFNPFDVPSHIFYHEWPKDFWLTKYNMNPIKKWFDCCSDLSISFHYINHHQMMAMDFLIYKLRAFGRFSGCSKSQQQLIGAASNNA